SCAVANGCRPPSVRTVRGQQWCVGANGGLGSSADVVAAARSPATAWVTAV
ncbi:unnamed protein product, partial [Urochloa humidicola]